MTQGPIICFGQQPCGFFPKRYLYAKVKTARRLQTEIGGEVVFFYHDSDHDPRETRTILRHRHGDVPLMVNFAFTNKIQKKFTPLYLKQVVQDWHAKTALQLTHFVDHHWVEIFKNLSAGNVADFCLEMYRVQGLLEGVRIVRSSDPAVRAAACAIDDFFVDVPYSGEIVRARPQDGALKLHEGGDRYITLPMVEFTKEQISPARDSRLKWMQSVIHCTHYIAGAGEQAYLRKDDAPGVTYVNRDTIERFDEAYTDFAS
jgi:hypothetical protein